MAYKYITYEETEGFTAFLEKREPVWDESTVF